MIKKIIGGCDNSNGLHIEITLGKKIKKNDEYVIFLTEQIIKLSETSIQKINDKVDSLDHYTEMVDLLIEHLDSYDYGLCNISEKEKLIYYTLILSYIIVLQHFGIMAKNKYNYVILPS